MRHVMVSDDEAERLREWLFHHENNATTEEWAAILHDVRTQLQQPHTPFVQRFFDLSTCHLSQEAQEWCEDHCTAHSDYGWFLSVREPDEARTPEDERIPTSLATIFRYAEAAGCGWVMFHAGGPPHPDLDEYEPIDDGRRRTEAEGPILEDAPVAP